MSHLFLQMSAALLVILRSESAPSVGRLSQAEWESYHELDHQGPGTYTFGYDVEDPASGNTQFRQEERLPNGTVTGSYGIVEPDGNVRVVRYIADSMGYRVTIENSKTRYGRHPSAGGLVGSNSNAEAIYPRQINSIPINQISGKLHTFEYNRFQNSKLYSPATSLHYFYKNKLSPSTELGVFN